MVSFRCIHHTILVLVLIIAASAVAQDVTAVRANSIEIANGRRVSLWVQKPSPKRLKNGWDTRPSTGVYSRSKEAGS